MNPRFNSIGKEGLSSSDKQIIKSRPPVRQDPAIYTFCPNKFDSEKDVILNLGNILFEYNYLRRHGGLNYITPFDKLEKVTKLLS
jgi:hypothetical protein